MIITSAAFKNNKAIPAKYTCDGGDLIPPLSISDLPPETKSLAIVMEDPDAPHGTFDHWVVFDIDPEAAMIREGEEPQGILGMNGTGSPGYKGPCPPSGTHHYVFTAYALDSLLGLPAGASKKDVLAAMRGHVIESAKLIGLYSRGK